VLQRYQPMNRYRGKTLITRYQASRESYDVTSAQLSIVAWKMLASCAESCYLNISIRLVSVWEVNFVLYISMLKYLYISMLKYVINRLMHAFFHIRTVIISRLTSSLGQSSCRYRSLGMIIVLIWKKACINL
jgi:hypothetical protein